MPKYVGGTAMVLQWINSAGTVTIQNQYTKFDTNWAGDTVDVSSGSTTAKQYLATLSDFTASYVGFSNGKSSPFGTADLKQLEPTNYGTLVWAPLGTATGNPKGSVACYIKKQDVTYPFAGAVQVTIDFQGTDVLLNDVNSSVW